MNTAVAIRPNRSVAFIVNVYEPAVLGVPDSCPLAEFRDSPAGRLPDILDQLYGEVPPTAARVWL